MADLSHWFAQACEYHDSEGTFKVIYFQDRQELITVGEELLRNGDSWSDDLFSSKMGSNVYKSQVTEPSPDTRSRVLAGNRDLERFFSGKLFEDFPGSPISSAVPKNNIPKASMALDQDLVNKGGNKAPSSQTMATNSSKNYVQEGKEKEELMKNKERSEKTGFWEHLIKLLRTMRKDRQVNSFQDYKTQEGGSSLPRELFIHLNSLDDNPFRGAKPPRHCKYALLCGITTEFNPSGVWVIEELYNDNDMQESNF